jgi:hypothetical protein
MADWVLNDSKTHAPQRSFCYLVGQIHLNHLEIAGFILYNLDSWTDLGGVELAVSNAGARRELLKG